MDQSLFNEALKGLVAAGPVATILGVFCYALWKQQLIERKRHEEEEHSLLAKLDRQHDKMLKLAVRVQRAVEVLAGIEHDHTEVEEVLDEDAKKAKKQDQD